MLLTPNNIIKHILIAVLFSLFILSCKSNITEDVVLATVGNEQITVDDFRENYEFGLPHLKDGPNPKLSYLNYMIYEKIISIEGYNLGFNNSENVKKKEKKLIDELLVEELFIKDVNSTINISPEDVRNAIQKSHVSWKMNFWFEDSEEKVNFIKNEISNDGFEAVINKVIKSNPEVKLKSQDFETDYITWMEIAPNVLDKIKDLRIDEISEPIKMGKGYFIFQIKDIRREPITDNEFTDKYDRFKQILFYRKVTEKASKYIDSIMTPLNVKTKGTVLFKIANSFIEWKQDTIKQKFVDFISNNKKDLLEENLVSFDKTSWSVAEFIEKFEPKKVNKDAKLLKQIASEINNQIALKVRNNVMIDLALESNLDKKVNLTEQLNVWRDKWVYTEARNQYLKDISITEDEAKNFFEDNITYFRTNINDTLKFEEYKKSAKRLTFISKAETILMSKIDSLKNKLSININHAVLDTIQTIDFEKSRWQSLQVYKRSSNRLAVPIIDPAWKIK